MEHIKTTDEEIAIVTLHPDCGFEVNENFECPAHHQPSDKYNAIISATEIDSYACAGCPACILIYTAIQQAAPEVLKQLSRVIRSDAPLDRFWIERKSQTLDFDFCFASEIDANESVRVPRYRFYGQQFEDEGSTIRHLPGDTRSAESMSFARRCIETCNTEHTCLRDRSPAFVPSRLLDIRDESVRLVETSETDVTADYACLSHCWGREPTVMLRTTSSNLQTFKRCISWGTIPRTFQDAIRAAREVGVFFLWIDALCIIQDDALDWQHQSTVMADIYENAYLTIAAAMSVDTNSGCFTSRGELAFRQVRTPLAIVKFRDGTTRNMYATRPYKHFAGNFPLLKRGWVCQERLLSPRVLYFAEKELIWECREELDCECRAWEISVFRRANLRHSSPHEESVAWKSVLYEFTNSSLTYATDAFPALSGIVKAHQISYADTYIAGMWTKCLPEMLLWFYWRDPHVLNINTHPWRAPSWSWASQIWNGDLRFLECEKSTATTHSVVCEPSGADPTGELAFAHLTLNAKAIKATLQRQEMEGLHKYSIHLANGHDIHPAWQGGVHADTLVTSHFGLSDPRLAAGVQSLSIVLAQIGTVKDTQLIHPIFRTGEHDRVERLQRCCILLAQHIDHTDHWVRIGLAVVTDCDPGLAIDDVREQAGDDFDAGKIESAEVAEKARLALEKRTSQSRDIFRQFDEAPMQDFVVW